MNDQPIITNDLIDNDRIRKEVAWQLNRIQYRLDRLEEIVKSMDTRFNDHADAINNIQIELGLNPSGEWKDVAERLDILGKNNA